MAGIGVAGTADADGNPEAALVGLAATSSGELIFDSAVRARKVANLAVNPRVALVVGWTDDVSVRAEGVAGFAIVRVKPRWLRYYDSGRDPSASSKAAGSNRVTV
jgi:pyridoxine/pyridoxamine 5'-phosphate oxidase